MLSTFDGYPHGWRKFQALINNLDAGSRVWADRAVDLGSPHHPAPTVGPEPIPGRMDDATWEALNKATGRNLPRGRVVSLDAYRREEPAATGTAKPGPRLTPTEQAQANLEKLEAATESLRELDKG